MADTRIPLTLLTGFLGAGKTTLLNTLLWQKAFADAAVFINEFGEIGVDHLLVEKIDEDIVVLDSGCICCSMRGDLPKALRKLFSRAQRKDIPTPQRVVLETSGISDPAPVIYSLLSDPFIAERFRCDGVVTVVSATHGLMQIDTHLEALKQVVMADRLILSKCDAVETSAIEALEQHLTVLNPGAPKIRAVRGAIAAHDIIDCGLYDPSAKMPDVAHWLGEARLGEKSARTQLSFGKHTATGNPHHAQGVSSFVISLDPALSWGEVGTLLDMLLQAHGGQLLRIKGLVQVTGEPGPRLVQCVQHVRYPSLCLPAWPDEAGYAEHATRLVVITLGLNRATLEASIANMRALIKHHEATPHAPTA